MIMEFQGSLLNTKKYSSDKGMKNEKSYDFICVNPCYL